MKYILIVLVLSLLVLNSCTKCSHNNNKIQTTDKEKVTEIQKTDKNKKQDISTSQNTEGKIISNTKYSDAKIDMYYPGGILPPDELKKYLPTEIPGTKRSAPSTGIIYGESGNVSTVSFTYDFPKGGLAIRITDYGELNNIPPYDLKYFNELPTAPGMEVETIVNDMGKGYVLWNADKNSGEMYYLLANRFIIKLEGFTLPAGTGGLIYFFDKINKQKLINRISK